MLPIDTCELRLAERKLIMFLAIDRVSKFTVVEFHQSAGKMEGAAFLRHVVDSFPYALHTVLTDNGMAFANLPKNRGRYPEMEAMFGGYIFDRVCKEHGIEHRLTKPYHPWTNGQAEKMNRTVKDATVKTFHYPSLDALKAHVLALCQHTTLPNISKQSDGKRRPSTSATLGNAIRRRLRSIRTTSPQNHTPSRISRPPLQSAASVCMQNAIAELPAHSGRL